ncbi:hypothetical protein CHARACLAT_007004 [Characodon lateralis]|uniref:Uncharacterized protein n=1 Tax=Characodon lateralis TaxID=208331 RepID=A0ABU7CYM2_9TELE|nr:hypothetical protein [Characodon lateralis]
MLVSASVLPQTQFLPQFISGFFTGPHIYSNKLSLKPLFCRVAHNLVLGNLKLHKVKNSHMPLFLWLYLGRLHSTWPALRAFTSSLFFHTITYFFHPSVGQWKHNGFCAE